MHLMLSQAIECTKNLKTALSYGKLKID